jgi:hypothetical protein
VPAVPTVVSTAAGTLSVEVLRDQTVRVAIDRVFAATGLEAHGVARDQVCLSVC